MLGHLLNDLTLILAVLEEIDKIIGTSDLRIGVVVFSCYFLVLNCLLFVFSLPEWQPDSVVILHPSCVQALKIITFMLDGDPQVSDKKNVPIMQRDDL